MDSTNWLDGSDEMWARILLETKDALGIVGAVKAVTFVGQERIKRQIGPFLDKAVIFPNTLILGEPGIGKTLLARWIAFRRDENLREFLCPVRPDVLDDGIVLLDECHRQRQPEPLFRLMENRHVTVLGATTRPAKLDPAFRSRFFLELNLLPYPVSEMEDMVRHLTDMKLTDGEARLFARASAGNPRQAERIVATAEAMDTTEPIKVLSTCKITADGLTDMHIMYLVKLRDINRPIGKAQLAMLLHSDEQSLMFLERLLLDYGLIELLPNGRAISRKGRAYLKGLTA